MKSLAALKKELESGDISKERELELYFHLAVGNVNIDNELSIEYIQGFLKRQPDETKYIAMNKIVQELLSKLHAGIDPIKQGQFYLEAGDIFRRNQPDTAYYYYNRSLKLFTELQKAEFIAESYCKISYFHNKKGNYKESESLLLKAEKLAKESGSSRVLSKCYTQYGEINYYRGDYDKTLEYYLKSLSLDEESGDIREISKSYNNIGTVYYKIHDFEKAEEYFAKALEMKLNLPEKSGLEFSYNNLGALNFMLKRYDKSLELYHKSLAIRVDMNDIKGQIGCCCNIGGVHFQQEALMEALKWFHQAYDLCLKVNDKHLAALIMGNIANTQKELGEFEQAVASANIQLDLAEQLEEKPLLNTACKTLYSIYELKDDFCKALEFFKRHKQLSDEIYCNDSEKKISEIKARFDVEKKERIAESHRLKNVELLQANKLIQDKNKELEAYKDDLLQIYKVLSHDIANDLSVIESGLALYRDLQDDAMLDKIEKRVYQSIDTIKKQRSRVSSLSSQRKLKPYDFDNILQLIVSSYEQIDFEINGKGRILADETIYSVFENLTNNSLNHGKASRIKIAVIPQEKNYEIHFSDNGKGIPREIKEKIFQEGYSYGDSGNTGIGLHIVKTAIERYGGSISVQDNIPEGTSFIITLRKA